MRLGRLPTRSGDPRADAVAELRWAMGGAGLTVDKLAYMTAVTELPSVARAIAEVSSAARPVAAFEAVTAAARALGDSVHARLLRASLGIDYAGAGKNLTARRDEFVAEHNAARGHGGRNVLPDTQRAIYAIEDDMLRALVTALGAPAVAAAAVSPAAPTAPTETLEYDVTYRLRGRAGVEAEVVHVVRALLDGATEMEIPYACGTDDGGPAALTVLEGGLLIEDRSVGRPGFRVARVRYPTVLPVGSTHRLRYDVHYPGTSANPDTWFTINPGRALERLTVRVAFDVAAVPQRVWQADGVVLDSGGGDPDAGKPLDPGPGCCVEVSFESPTPGLGHGVAWAWD